MFRLSLLLLLLWGSSTIADDAPQPLTPAEAAKKVDQQVTVELAVKSTGGGRNRYLNSAPDFSQAGNFTIFIPQAAMPKFTEAKIDKPDEFYYGKTIQVTGTVHAQSREAANHRHRSGADQNHDEKSGPPVHKATHIYKQVGDSADQGRQLSLRRQAVAAGRRLDSRRRPDQRPPRKRRRRAHGSLPRATATSSSRSTIASLPRRNCLRSFADIEDAFRWIRKEGPQLFAGRPERIAVVGGSAGGYLTLTAGFRVKPRPAALVSLWGYGDLVGPWYSEPSPHPRHHTIKLSRDEAYQQVSGPPISDSRERKGNGGAFYQFCRQQGLWPKAVSGWDPHTEAEKFAPFMPVKNVTPDIRRRC